MKKKSIITLVLLLAIGFAAVSTTLIINGTIGIGTNNDNFVDGVVFDEESLSSSEGTTAKISESGRTITFTTQEMKNIDEIATVNFKIKNYSQYDAVLGTPAVSCYFVDDHQTDVAVTPTPTTTTHEYMTVTPGTELDGKTITAGGGLSEASSITVKQKKSYIGDEKQIVKFQCVINAEAKESSTTGVEKPKKLPSGVELTDANNNGVADVGEEIAIGEEHFYVISNVDNKINALAKYNLKVGNIYNLDDSLESTILPSEEGYGIQNNQMRGKVDGEKKYGTVGFSNFKGWPYENNDTITIRDYDGPVKEALYSDNGYEKYIQKTISTASVRLITKREIEVLINDENILSYETIKDKADAKGYSWLYSTTYWTQSADFNGDNNIWGMYSNGYFGGNGFSSLRTYGVRPVVEIPLV